jgi:hypothetical protein
MQLMRSAQVDDRKSLVSEAYMPTLSEPAVVVVLVRQGVLDADVAAAADFRSSSSHPRGGRVVTSLSFSGRGTTSTPAASRARM